MPDDHPVDLIGYLYKELPPEEMLRVKEHVAVCPQCKEELLKTKEIVKAYRSLPKPVPPAGLRQKVVGAAAQCKADSAASVQPAIPVSRPESVSAVPELVVDYEEGTRPARHSWFFHPAWPVAASVLFIFAVLIQFSPRRDVVLGRRASETRQPAYREKDDSSAAKAVRSQDCAARQKQPAAIVAQDAGAAVDDLPSPGASSPAAEEPGLAPRQNASAIAPPPPAVARCAAVEERQSPLAGTAPMPAAAPFPAQAAVATGAAFSASAVAVTTTPMQIMVKPLASPPEAALPAAAPTMAAGMEARPAAAVPPAAATAVSPYAASSAAPAPEAETGAAPAQSAALAKKIPSPDEPLDLDAVDKIAERQRLETGDEKTVVILDDSRKPVELIARPSEMDSDQAERNLIFLIGMQIGAKEFDDARASINLLRRYNPDRARQFAAVLAELEITAAEAETSRDSAAEPAQSAAAVSVVSNQEESAAPESSESAAAETGTAAADVLTLPSPGEAETEQAPSIPAESQANPAASPQPALEEKSHPAVEETESVPADIGRQTLDSDTSGQRREQPASANEDAELSGGIPARENTAPLAGEERQTDSAETAAPLSANSQAVVSQPLPDAAIARWDALWEQGGEPALVDAAPALSSGQAAAFPETETNAAYYPAQQAFDAAAGRNDGEQPLTLFERTSQTPAEKFRSAAPAPRAAVPFTTDPYYRGD